MNETMEQGAPQDEPVVTPVAPVVSAQEDDEDEQLASALQAEHEAQQKAKEHPVQALWNVLKKDRSEAVKATLSEVPRSIARGVTNLATEATESISENLGSVDSPVKRSPNRLKEAAEVVKAGEDKFLGKRSDDAVAGFVESAAQFMAGYALTPEMKIAKLGKAAHIVDGAVRGAMVDFHGFDPREAGLAELAAKAPVPVLSQLGELLSVDADDSQLVARAKRAAAGMVPGVVMDLFVAGTKNVLARKVLASSTSTPEAKAAAEATAAQTDKVIAEIQAGTHTPEGAKVVVRPDEDGVSWKLEPADNGKATFKTSKGSEYTVSGKGTTRNKAATGESFGASDRTVFVTTDTMDKVQVAFMNAKAKGLRPSVREMKDGVVRLVVKNADGSINDQLSRNFPHTEAPEVGLHPIEVWNKNAEGEYAWHFGNDITEVSAGHPEHPDVDAWVDGVPVVRGDREALEAQAETINIALADHDAAEQMAQGGLPKDQKDFAEELILRTEKATPKDIQGILEDIGLRGFDVPFASTVDEHFARIEELGNHIWNEMKARHAAGETFSDERMNHLASVMIESVPEWLRPAVMGKVLKEGNMGARQVKAVVANNVLEQYGRKLAGLWDVLDARPHDPVLGDHARLGVLNYLSLSRALAEDDSMIGSALRVRKFWSRNATKRAQMEAAMAAEHTQPVKLLGDGAQKEINDLVAGMSTRELKDFSRLMRMSDGKALDHLTMAKATKLIREPGKRKAAFEFWVNNVLSGPTTQMTAATMNAITSFVNPVARMLGGAATMNRHLAREGADIAWSNVAFLKDNLKAAGMAFKEGNSILNRAPEHRVSIGGYVGDNLTARQKIANVVGTVVRLPTRSLMTIDEFSRVTNYRSYIRAKSLRKWRGEAAAGTLVAPPGTSIDAVVAKQVEEDLRLAFNEGRATIPQGLKYAEEPGLSAALGTETFGGGAQDFFQKNLVTKFIAPFVKTSVNAARWTWKSTPLLNRWQSEAKAIFEAGGEEATVLHARSALVGSMWGLGLYKVMQGELTGGGPKDKAARALWLEDHKPYTITVGGEQYSIRRGDPLFTPLMIMADAAEGIHEALASSSDDKDIMDVAEGAAVGVITGFTAAMANKTYLSGLTQFFQAWAGDDEGAMKRWLAATAGGFVPYAGALAQLNTDPHLHEASSIVDRMRARIPGLSSELPVKYSIFGEPVSRMGGWQPFDALPEYGTKQHSVATELLDLESRIPPMSKDRMMGVKVDLLSKEQWAAGAKTPGVSPYDRMMEELRKPSDGEPPLKKALADLVASKDYQEEPDLSERQHMVEEIVDEYHDRALDVLEEYPALEAYIEQQQDMKGEGYKAPTVGQKLLEALAR